MWDVVHVRKEVISVFFAVGDAREPLYQGLKGWVASRFATIFTLTSRSGRFLRGVAIFCEPSVSNLAWTVGQPYTPSTNGRAIPWSLLRTRRLANAQRTATRNWGGLEPMRRRTKRIWVWLAIVLGGATMFQGVGFTSNTGAYSGGCTEFYTNGVVTSVDFCYLLDCENGFLGGLVDPCGQGGLLVDCNENVSTTDEETEDTTTTTTGLLGF